jgi:hypothetical protein
VSLIERQGLGAPPLFFETCIDEERRKYFRTLLPQENAEQAESCLCCRKKSKSNKFRFSLDPGKMTKKNNPNYVGKMTMTTPAPPLPATAGAAPAPAPPAASDPKASSSQFVLSLSLKNQVDVACIRIVSSFGKHTVTVLLLNQYLNLLESGAPGRLLTGTYHIYAAPQLILRIDTETASRTVMEVNKLTPTLAPLSFTPLQHRITLTRAATPAAATESGKGAAAGASVPVPVSAPGSGSSRSSTLAKPQIPEDTTKCLVHFDYPLTMFLAFAITCAVEAHRILLTNDYA